MNLYSDSTEVDYRGSEVSVEAFVRVLTGRHKPGTVENKKLHSDGESDLLVYLTGHGGDEFIKFQDDEEIAADDFRDIFREMRAKRRYGRILFIVDTCQAATLASKFSRDQTPEIFFIGSSLKSENSYAHHSDPFLGVAVIDRFTRSMLHYFHNLYTPSSTISDLLSYVDKPRELRAHVAVTSTLTTDGGGGSSGGLLLADFFSSSLPVTMTRQSILPPPALLPSLFSENDRPSSLKAKSPDIELFLSKLTSLRSMESKEYLADRHSDGIYLFHSSPMLGEIPESDAETDTLSFYLWILIIVALMCWFQESKP